MNGSDSNPFVGLRPFESDESLLFFGRQDQTLELLQRLNRHHFVAVTGGSGSGKSSIIKAGLIPRLKAGYLVNDSDRWVISVMKPGQSPLCNLADAILTRLDFTNHELTATGVQEKIIEEGADAILDILKMWKHGTNFFLLVDQFEELFRFSINDKDVAKRDEAIDFVNVLLELSNQTDLSLYVVITMRSDFIGDCAQFYGLPEAMNQSQYIVPRLNRIQLETTINGPVRLYDGKINPALTARLLNDAQMVKDELPLLQHALMRIWDREKGTGLNGELDVEDYVSIGGIEKALSNHADEALHGLSAAELTLTKKMFQALTGIDENGRKVRRPVHLSELQRITGANKETLLSVINRFIEDNRSFLVINRSGNTDDVLIDISHESLIRQWNTLNSWVDEEAESGKMLMRLSESAGLYSQNKKDLLTGNELQQILQWYRSFQPGAAWAHRYTSDYENNVQYLQQSEKEALKQHLKKIRNRRLLVGALLLIILIISGFAFLIYNNYLSNKRALALNYWKSSQTARVESNFLDALHLIAEASVITNDDGLIQNLLIDGEAYLPRTSLKSIFLQDDIINSAVFSADGKRILIAGNSGGARIIDKITGKQIGPDMQHPWPVISAVFSPDNNLVLTTGGHKTAFIWDVATGKQVYTLKHSNDILSAVFSPDGKFILTGSDSCARVWQISAEKVTDSFHHVAGVSSAVFSPDGKSILTTCRDAMPHLWNLDSKKEIPLTPADDNGGAVYGAGFSHDGSKFLTISDDSTIGIWDTSGKKLATLKHDARITDAVFSPDGKQLLTACEDRAARLWDIETEQQVGTSLRHEGPVYSVTFSADGKQILTAGWDRTLRLWDITSETEIKRVSFKHQGIVKGGAFSPDGIKIVTASYDSTAGICNIVTGKQTNSLKHRGRVNSAVFSFDGTRILSACNDSAVRIWDAATGKQLDSIKLRDKANSAVFSSDGKWILTTGVDNYALLWDITVKPHQLMDSFKYQADISTAIFSADKKTILIAGGDSAAHILDIRTGKQVMSFKHDDIVTGAAFSPDGKSILTSSWDNTARLWDIGTGRQSGPAMKHNSYVTTAAFSPDGKWIITACFDGTTHMWNTVNLRESGVPAKHGAPVTCAVFGPDKWQILTTGYDSTAQLSEIQADLDISPSLFKLQAQAVTGVSYNIETGETGCIAIDKWEPLKEKYESQARDHYKVCKYPEYNLWRHFNTAEAKKIRPGEDAGK